MHMRRKSRLDLCTERKNVPLLPILGKKAFVFMLLLLSLSSVSFAANPEPSAAFTVRCTANCYADYNNHKVSATGQCAVSADCEFDRKIILDLHSSHRFAYTYNVGDYTYDCQGNPEFRDTWSGGINSPVPHSGGQVIYTHDCDKFSPNTFPVGTTVSVTYSVSATPSCPAGYDVVPGNYTYECTPTSSVNISGTPPSPVFDGDAYSFSPTVNSLNNVEFIATGLPTGLSIDPITGKVEGIPTVVNSFSGSITATDTTNRDKATLQFTIVVKESPNKAPVADISGPTRAGIGEAVEFSGLNSRDPDANDSIASYTWSVLGGTVISGQNQAGVSIEFSTLGSASVTLLVTDSRGKQSSPQTHSVTVKPFGDLTNRGLGSGGVLCDAASATSDRFTNGTNPINGADGNKVQAETDYTGAGVHPIVLTRYYNSLATKREQLGSNWRHNFNQSIELDTSNTPNQAFVYRADGSAIRFLLFGTQWLPMTGFTEQLTETDTAWQLIENNDTVKLFTKVSGNNESPLSKITLRSGISQSLSYLADLLEKITDDFGRSLQFAYDADGRIETITDPAGKLIKYTYVSDNIDTVTYQDANTRRYVYENVSYPHHLTGIINQTGVRYASWTYDTKGRANSSNHAGGANTVNIDYNADGTTTFTDALGQARKHSFNIINGMQKLGKIAGPACNVCGGRSKNNSYDRKGNLDIVTDFKGNVTDYDYNSRGLLERVTEAKDSLQERTTITLWHPDYRVPLCKIASRATTYYDYNDYNTNVRGQLRASIVYDTTDSTLFPTAASKTCDAIYARSDKLGINQREINYTYVQGLLYILTGPRIDVYANNVYDYDFANGNLLTIKNPLRQITTTFSNYDAHGRPQIITDANGLITTISYDLAGRKDIVIAGQEVTDYDYYPNGSLDMVTLPDGSLLDYQYDDANRLTDIYDQLGNHIQYTLDDLGNRLQTDTSDANGVLKRTHSAQYDLENRLLRTLGAANQTTEYVSYDANGNLEEVQDPNMNSTRYSYDALNRLETSTNAKNGVTRTTYDEQNNVTSITDPNGLVTEYSYDGLGNRTQMISPDTGTTNYTSYDEAGNLLSMTNALGKTTTYKYDPLDRLIKVIYQDGTTTAYIYDRDFSNGMGRLSVMEYVSGAFAGNSVDTWKYDKNGHVIAKQQWNTLWQSNSDFTTSYAYDPVTGQMKTKTTPGGHKIVYSYLDGQVSGITVDTQSVISNITYDPFGPATQWTFGNSKVANRIYDQDGLLESYPQGNKNLTNLYYPTGNLKSTTNSRNKTVTTAYQYDELNRVSSYSAGTNSETYNYDANNNRLLQTINTINYTSTIATTSNQLMSSTGPKAKTYRYDAVGNRTGDGITTYQYDDRGRLNGLNDHAMKYVISGLGHRNWKKGSYRRSQDLNQDDAVNDEDRQLMQDAIDGIIPKSQKFDQNNDLSVTLADMVAFDSAVGDAINNANADGSNNGDGEGIRIDVRFVYNAQGELEGEYDDNGNTIQEIIWFEGQPISVLRDRAIYFIDTDHLGTPRSISNDDNEVVWQWKSDPYGASLPNMVIDEDADGDGGLFVFNLRFAGQYHDIESGLHYNINRFYDPENGRYLESDPIGIEGGLNSYIYASANPVGNVDALGLCTGELGIPCGYGIWEGLVKEVTGIFNSAKETRPGVFGCIIGGVSYTRGDRDPQASLGPCLGAGFLLCEPSPTTTKSCPVPQRRKNCGNYDPNCDNEVLYGYSETLKGIGFGIQQSADGTKCIAAGLFISGPISNHLGSLYE